MSLDRLYRLQAENVARQFEIEAERRRFATLASRHKDGTAPRAVNAFNLFQTPKNIAQKMIDLAKTNKQNPKTILEPSAGLGRIFLPAWDAWGERGHFVLVEQNQDCMRELYSMTEGKNGCRLKQGDFLTMEALGRWRFDIILMNPPFERGRDIKHILHAQKMLAPGGLLVGLCYNGLRQNKQLQPICDTWEPLPANSFQAEGTAAAVALITIKK